GELEHKTPKKWYLRTSRKNFVQQITQIERRQSRICKIRSTLNRERNNPSTGMRDIDEPSDIDPLVCYHIGKTQNNPVHIPSFLQANAWDPSLKGFLPMLKNHLLFRIQKILCVAPNLEVPGYTTGACLIFFQGDRIYQHAMIRFNYTTYDIRRVQDIVNPGTSHCNVMLLSGEATIQSPSTKALHPSLNVPPHPYIYAKVLGIYHVNVIYTGPG
ncbi:hypothetical protein BDZ94DRAFT_1148130, partial [Collybia nuda]